MDVVFIYKADGTIQCENRGPIPLEHHAAELRQIGAREIFAQGNVRGPFPVLQLCGAPSGRVNAFAICEDNWEMIARGFVGTRGFRMWYGAPLPDLKLDGSASVNGGMGIGPLALSARVQPVLIRELVGRPCRSYVQDDTLGNDFVPERVNIEHDEDGRISDLWFG